jgi:hypothetical protein
MDVSMAALEVDGSLDNPYVVASVAIWAVVLVLATARAVSSWFGAGRSSGAGTYRLAAGWLLLLGPLYLFTRFFECVIGGLLYQLTSSGSMGVGFWGGPPVIHAYCAGALAGIAIAAEKLRARPGAA